MRFFHSVSGKCNEDYSKDELNSEEEYSKDEPDADNGYSLNNQLYNGEESDDEESDDVVFDGD
jgi:hypothetical protein